MGVRYSLGATGRPAQTSLGTIGLRFGGMMASFGSKRTRWFLE